MKSILIVEDEPNTRAGIAWTLQEWGGANITIDTAENGANALSLLEDGDYDLLITDIRMPVMDGIQLLEEIRERGNEILCLLLTGFAEFAYAQSALRLGVVDYLLKPLQQEQLILAVEKALAKVVEQKKSSTSEMSSALPTSHPNPAVDKALQYIIEHIHEALSMKEVAAHVHLNASYFSVLFKEELGITFIDYLTEYRLQKARELLVNTVLSLDEVSESIGYQTTSYFIKIFKKHQGVTPKQYRDLLKKGQEYKQS